MPPRKPASKGAGESASGGRARTGARTPGRPAGGARRNGATGAASRRGAGRTALESPSRKGALMKGKLKVVMVSAEMVPLAKVGGLGDVIGSLSQVMSRAGHRTLVLMPHYRKLTTPAGFRLGQPLTFPVLMDRGMEMATFTPATWTGLNCDVYLVGGGDYFDRDGIYLDPATGQDYPDNARRFIFFQKAVLEGLKAIDFRPDILHLNDYQTGLIPAYLRMYYGEDSYYKTCATVYSIHNLGYQGLYPPETAREAGIPDGLFYPMSQFEFWGRFNFMKSGVMFADLVTTVSERYAHEITESNEFGFGLEGVLKELGGRLKGILNGIDTSVWNPQTDRHIAQHFGPQNLHLKRRNKEALLLKMGLPPGRAGAPLIGIISRLADQKGFDLIEEISGRLMQHDLSLVVLGDGQEKYRQLFERLRAEHPHKVGFECGFNEPLAHLIEAGSDMFLMPSRYEPCGLNQMYSMRYGTVPIVRATGGLADTVRNFDPVHRTGTGFSFEASLGEALYEAIQRALAAYADPDAWRALMLSGMSQDFSWAASAGRYVEAYEQALNLRRRQAFTSWLTSVVEV
jgi:starch synthase